MDTVTVVFSRFLPFVSSGWTVSMLLLSNEDMSLDILLSSSRLSLLRASRVLSSSFGI
jgi:hypothetical protein